MYSLLTGYQQNNYYQVDLQLHNAATITAYDTKMDAEPAVQESPPFMY